MAAELDRPTLVDLRPLRLADQVAVPLPRPSYPWELLEADDVELRPEHLLRMRANGLRDYCGRAPDRMSLGTRKEFDLSDCRCRRCAAALRRQDDLEAAELGGEG